MVGGAAPFVGGAAGPVVTVVTIEVCFWWWGVGGLWWLRDSVSMFSSLVLAYVVPGPTLLWGLVGVVSFRPVSTSSLNTLRCV